MENNIAKRIITDAERMAERAIKEARMKSADEVIKLRAKLEFEEQQIRQELEKSQQLARERKEKMARNIERKNELEAQQELLREIYDDVKTKLISSPSTLSAIISTHVKALKKPNDKVERIKDGAIISNANYDIKITVDELLKAFKNNHEAKLIALITKKE